MFIWLIALFWLTSSFAQVSENTAVLLKARFKNPQKEKQTNQLIVECLDRREKVCLQLQFHWQKNDGIEPIGLVLNQDQAGFILKNMTKKEDWVKPIKSFGNAGIYLTKGCSGKLSGCLLKRIGLSVVVDVPTFAPQLLAHFVGKLSIKRRSKKIYINLQRFIEGKKTLKPVRSKKYFFINTVKSIDFLTDVRLWEEYYSY